ncbi:hypothetical protein HNR65_001646 [Desulfosalsimonas propionicica]|uniref:DUF2802 domain-containing protein n=1 Tax=Desulfosalsimonas propionicica TaxID=332175 RepID=A0A7W0C909_9BACT|nr:hypothetical protein [Desulfosalsimonas propionicica]MBA2881320.1 hypothetical protein [Desulfosalsimonas propionicica]
MDSLTTLVIFMFCLAGIACAVVLAAAIWCRRVILSINSRINELNGRLREMEDRAGSVCENTDTQARSLTSDQLSARFEQADKMPAHDVSAKYRHVARLARSGLGAAELSEIMDVSLMEADQMLLLARMTGKTA